MSRLAGLWSDRSGASTLLTLLTLPVLLGFTAFAVDGGMAYVTRRNAQGAADSAAHTAAVAANAGDNNLLDQAKGVALQYGLKDGQGGVTIAVTRPPTSGPNAGDPDAIEVTVRRPMLTFFSQMFGGTASTLTVRSVSKIARPTICVLALNPTKVGAVTVNGSPAITLTNCGMQVDSNSASGLLANGSPTITADQIAVVGTGALLNGGVVLNLKTGLKTKAASVADPYAGVPVPATAPCGYTPPAAAITTTTTIPNPTGVQVVCTNNLSIGGTAKVTFTPGIYVFKGVGLLINGVAPQTVTAHGVSFVFAKGTTGSTVGTVTINGTGTMDLAAPTSGTMAGLLFFTDPSGTQAGVTLNGGTTSSFSGAMHFPKSLVTVNGTNAVKGDCLQLVADSVTFNGAGTFGMNCGAGVQLKGGPTRIVE